MATAAHPTRFSSLRDLARLPWLDLVDGRLTADPSVGPAVDLHTHLALAFVRPMAVDLHRASERTEFYLPEDRALDLEAYQNLNFSSDDMSRLTRDLSIMSLTARGMRATHTVPNLLRDMKALGVEASVLLAIDWPALSANAESWLGAAKGEKSLVVFGSVHPFTPNALARLDAQIDLGARGIKVHPAVQLVAPDHPLNLRIYRRCGERGIPVFWHCGPVEIEGAYARKLSQVRLYERAIAENPKTTFVLGHSGALQMETAVDYARRYPNVWLELASQGLSNVRRIFERAPRDRIVFGTDWPFYHQAIGLAKVCIAAEGDDELRRAVLSGNARRLLKLDA